MSVQRWARGEGVVHVSVLRLLSMMVWEGILATVAGASMPPASYPPGPCGPGPCGPCPCGPGPCGSGPCGPGPCGPGPCGPGPCGPGPCGPQPGYMQGGPPFMPPPQGPQGGGQMPPYASSGCFAEPSFMHGSQANTATFGSRSQSFPAQMPPVSSMPPPNTYPADTYPANTYPANTYPATAPSFYDQPSSATYHSATAMPPLGHMAAAPPSQPGDLRYPSDAEYLPAYSNGMVEELPHPSGMHDPPVHPCDNPTQEPYQQSLPDHAPHYAPAYEQPNLAPPPLYDAPYLPPGAPDQHYDAPGEPHALPHRSPCGQGFSAPSFGPNGVTCPAHSEASDQVAIGLGLEFRVTGLGG